MAASRLTTPLSSARAPGVLPGQGRRDGVGRLEGEDGVAGGDGLGRASEAAARPAGRRRRLSIRNVPIGPPMIPPVTMPTMAEATARVAAPFTPACSKSGAKARPVAGPPVSVTDPASTPRSGGTPRPAATAAPARFCRTATAVASARKTRHRRPARAQERHARPEADRGEERDHERRLQRRVEGHGLVALGPQEGDPERHQQPADDRGRDVVAGEQPHPALERVSREEDQAGGGERAHEVQLYQAIGPRAPILRASPRLGHTLH